MLCMFEIENTRDRKKIVCLLTSSHFKQNKWLGAIPFTAYAVSIEIVSNFLEI